MFKVNNKDINGVVLVSLLLTFNIFHTLFSVFIVDFEQVGAGWEALFLAGKIIVGFHFCKFLTRHKQD